MKNWNGECLFGRVVRIPLLLPTSGMWRLSNFCLQAHKAELAKRKELERRMEEQERNNRTSAVRLRHTTVSGGLTILRS